MSLSISVQCGQTLRSFTVMPVNASLRRMVATCNNRQLSFAVLCVELIASVGVASAIAVCSHLFSALFRFVLPLQSQHQLDMLTAIAHRCGSAVSCIVPKDFLWASIHQEQKSTEFFPSPFYYLCALDVFMRNSRSARNRFSAAVVLCARRRLVF